METGKKTVFAGKSGENFQRKLFCFCCLSIFWTLSHMDISAFRPVLKRITRYARQNVW